MKKHSLSENILICLTAAFVSGVWQYEMYFGETVQMLMAYGSLLPAAVVWTMTAFSEGRSRRTGFAVFTLLFYILPQIPIIYAENSDYNAISDAAARLCGLFTRSAFFGNGSIVYPIAASSLFLLAFIAGELTAKRRGELSKAISSEDNADNG